MQGEEWNQLLVVIRLPLSSTVCFGLLEPYRRVAWANTPCRRTGFDNRAEACHQSDDAQHDADDQITRQQPKNNRAIFFDKRSELVVTGGIRGLYGTASTKVLDCGSGPVDTCATRRITGGSCVYINELLRVDGLRQLFQGSGARSSEIWPCCVQVGGREQLHEAAVSR